MRVDEEFAENDIIVVEKGLDINEQCDNGRTPLHYACRSFNTQLVNYLLECGADVHIEDHEGYTALHTAAYQ